MLPCPALIRTKTPLRDLDLNVILVCLLIVAPSAETKWINLVEPASTRGSNFVQSTSTDTRQSTMVSLDRFAASSCLEIERISPIASLWLHILYFFDNFNSSFKILSTSYYVWIIMNLIKFFNFNLINYKIILLLQINNKHRIIEL